MPGNVPIFQPGEWNVLALNPGAVVRAVDFVDTLPVGHKHYGEQRARAGERALALLLANTAPAERMFQNHGQQLMVNGGTSREIYWLEHPAFDGAPVNVRLLHDIARPTDGMGFCVYTRSFHERPWPDEMLAMALWIKNAEAEFLTTAVPHPCTLRQVRHFVETLKKAGAEVMYRRYYPLFGDMQAQYEWDNRLAEAAARRVEEPPRFYGEAPREEPDPRYYERYRPNPWRAP